MMINLFRDYCDAVIHGHDRDEIVGAVSLFLIESISNKNGEKNMREPIQQHFRFMEDEGADEEQHFPSMFTDYSSNFTVKAGYEELADILYRALEQSQNGKGAARHQSNGEPFIEQPIVTITKRYGIGFPLGQAEKKMEEAQRLDSDAAIKELLGAIVYIAAAVHVLGDLNESRPC